MDKQFDEATVADKIQAWHFICADHTTRKGHLKVEVGETLTVEGELMLCKRGLHACRKPLDALSYAPGPVACKVEVWGDVIEETDKLCGRNRKCLAMVDATNILHEFVCRFAERALLREREAGREPDPRSWAAIEVKRKWLKNEATDKELAAAGDAARDAARAAAWAAEAGAGDAAWAATWAATGAAERDWQNAELTKMLEEALAKEAPSHV